MLSSPNQYLILFKLFPIRPEQPSVVEQELIVSSACTHPVNLFAINHAAMTASSMRSNHLISWLVNIWTRRCLGRVRRLTLNLVLEWLMWQQLNFSLSNALAAPSITNSESIVIQ